MDERDRKQNSKKGAILIGSIMGIVVIAVIVCCILFMKKDQGYQDYTVQMKQYYVEYSEQYDYWDVITVEYPYLEGIDEEIQEQLNTLMYDTAMDRVNYWHLDPSEDVKAYQEEVFSIFASDVRCRAMYHSPYLLSLDYQEWYSAGHPLWATNGTERALTLDLMTGESYELSDVFEVNRDFVSLWNKALCERLDIDPGNEGEIDMLLSWLDQSAEESDDDFVYRPFFYITQDKDFVIGVSLDPVLWGAYTYEPTGWNFYAQLSAEDLEAFRKESEFWNKYEQSEIAGEVLPCEDRKDNIWLGEDAGVWDWDYEY